MTGTTPLITLNNGVQMPALGLGVYQSAPEETTDAVLTALHSGYRLIDTAAAYFNERQVGEAIARSGIDRSEIFVTTKLWISNYGYDSALRAFDVSLRKLGIEQLDLWLLHQPLPSDFDKTIAAYKAAEKLLAEGRVRAIGVSNQTPKELDELLSVWPGRGRRVSRRGRCCERHIRGRRPGGPVWARRCCRGSTSRSSPWRRQRRGRSACRS